MPNQKAIRLSGFDITIGLAALGVLFLSSLYNYLLFHTLAEFYSISIAVCIFVIGWNLRSTIHNNYLVFLSIAYLFIGLLDLLHTLSYKGMQIFRDYDYYANQLWIATRFMEAVTLCLGFSIAKRQTMINSRLVFLTYASLALLITASIFYWKIFPACFVEGSGLTPFKIYSEYVICAFLLYSFYLLFRNQQLFSSDIYRLMQVSILFTIASELAFTLYEDNYGIYNLIGHYFKIFSFYAIYRALIKTGIADPYKFYVKNMKDANDNLRQQSLEMENQVKYFNAVFNNSEVGIIVAADGRIFECNPKFLQISGFDPQDLLGRELSSIGNFQEIDAALTARLSDPERDTVGSTETTLTTRDNKTLWVSLSAKRYLDTNTGREMTVLVLEDINQRKQMELLREDVERIVRHDLLSPLNSILSVLYLMEDDQTTDLQEIRSYHALMASSAQRMVRLVKASSDLYKIENKTYEIQLQEVDLIKLFTDIEKELLPKLQVKDVTISHVTDELPGRDAKCSTCGDPFLLFELFSNLLVNAVEASNPGDVIHVFFCNEESSRKVQIFNSVPVPEDIVPRFFDKYVTAKKAGGTGLGTYIAKTLTEAHAGTISLETAKDFGTIVSVSLSYDCLL